MAYASVNVEACPRSPKTPKKDCKEWCSSLANCASGLGMKPSEENCWFAKTSSDPTEDLLNGVAENNVYTNIETVLEMVLVGRPTMQYLNGQTVDGTFDFEGEVDSCSSIQLGQGDRWGVNLGGRYKVTKVEVTSRIDQQQRSSFFWWGMFRLTGIDTVIVSDVELGADIGNIYRGSNNKICPRATTTSQGTQSVDCESSEGSFVYIYGSFQTSNLCNVRVFVSGSCCEHQVPENTDCPTKVNSC